MSLLAQIRSKSTGPGPGPKRAVKTLPLSCKALSSHFCGISRSVGWGRVGRRSAWRLLASPARPLILPARPPLLSEYRTHRVTAGDYAASLLGGDHRSIGVSDHVGLLALPTRDDPGEQGGREVAEGRVVMLAGDGHEPVIALGERRVDLAGDVSRHEERLSEEGVAGLGRSTMAAVAPRGAEAGHESAERARTGQGAEPARITEAAQDLGSVDWPHARNRSKDPLRVERSQHHRDALLELFDLLGKRQG